MVTSTAHCSLYVQREEGQDETVGGIISSVGGELFVLLLFLLERSECLQILKKTSRASLQSGQMT